MTPATVPSPSSPQAASAASPAVANIRERIARAVLAHGQWRLALYRSVALGAEPIDPEEARRDDACDFGRWIYAELAAGGCADVHCGRVRELHAAFHEESAEVLELAAAGRDREALAALAPGSPHESVASRLTLALLEWLQSVDRPESAG